MKMTKILFVLLASAVSAFGATVAQYNFEGGIPGAPMAGGGDGGVPAITDLSGNGNTMYAWNNQYGPSWSAVGATPTGYGLSSQHAGQDGYVPNGPLVGWTPLAWTIECAVKLDNIGGWNTMIGRDGRTGLNGDTDDEAALYFQNNGIDDHFRINFSTLGGQRYWMDSNFAAEAGKWYRLAVTSDGTTLTMFADKLDGAGFQNVGTMGLNTANDNSLRATGTWSFGRGYWGWWLVDQITGNMDDIRFSDVALTPDMFVPEPVTMLMMGAGALFMARRRK